MIMIGGEVKTVEYLEMIELIGEKLIQMVNRKCDVLIQLYG